MVWMVSHGNTKAVTVKKACDYADEGNKTSPPHLDSLQMSFRGTLLQFSGFCIVFWILTANQRALNEVNEVSFPSLTVADQRQEDLVSLFGFMA